MPGKKWSKEEDDFVRDNHGKIPSREIAEKLNRSKASVDCRIAIFGLGNNTATPWSEEDIEFLKNNFDKMEHKEIANILGRTTSSIHDKVLRLKLIKLPRRDKINIGDIFDNLEVTSEIKVPNRDYLETKYLCKCNKHEEINIEMSANSLRGGHSGCKKCVFDKMSEAHTTHGLSGKYRKLLNVLSSIKDRCTNTKSGNYRNYGARGIKICDEWNTEICENAAENFVKWSVENGYEEGLTIDRKNPHIGNYYPQDCKWVTWDEQHDNKRDTIFVPAFDDTKTINEWIKDPRCAKITRKTLWKRLCVFKWPPERAITEPSNKFEIDDEEIDAILKAREDGESYNSIGRKFNHDPYTISQIVKNPDKYRNEEAPEE